MGVDLAFVAGTQPAIGSEGFRSLRVFPVVAFHQGRATHLNLSRLGVHTALYSGVRQAHRPRLARARQRGVGHTTVFGHAIHLNQIQSEVAVPLQHIGRHGGGATGRNSALVESEAFENLFPHQLANQWQTQQALELGRRNFAVYALLKLDP